MKPLAIASVIAGTTLLLGHMAYATQILFDKKKNQVEFENYSSEPVRLNNLKLSAR
jgi:hypothetical protein